MSTILSNTITAVGGGGVSISVGTGATYISDGGAITNSNLVQSLTKSYVFFDGTAGTPTAADSFNHSSITDSSTGNYRNVFTNTMANQNFSGSGFANNKNTGDGAHNTSYLQLETANNSFQSADTNRVECMVAGDLA
tara:strand:- start:849 stop:1259 length:411 start_codon:yes stop_codon:yes gene_type:complete